MESWRKLPLGFVKQTGCSSPPARAWGSIRAILTFVAKTDSGAPIPHFAITASPSKTRQILQGLRNIQSLHGASMDTV
jgi:hypothetical protein